MSETSSIPTRLWTQRAIVSKVQLGNYQTSLLSPRTLRTAGCLFCLVLCATSQGQSAEQTDDNDFEPRTKAEAAKVRPLFDTAEMKQAESLILRHANDFRRGRGLKELVNNEALSKAAQYFANYMARTRKYGHTADGRQHTQRATDHGYDYCIVLENIGYYYNSEPREAKALASKLFVLWRDSKDHRENLLDPDVSESGIAIAQDPESKYFFAVHMLGRPESAWIVFTIVNRTDKDVVYLFLPSKETATLEPDTVATHRRCRPPRVRLASDKDAQAVNAGHGDRLTISGSQGKLDLQVEKSSENAD